MIKVVLFKLLRRGPGELPSVDLQLGVSMPRVGVGRSQNAAHDSDRVFELAVLGAKVVFQLALLGAK